MNQLDQRMFFRFFYFLNQALNKFILQPSHSWSDLLCDDQKTITKIFVTILFFWCFHSLWFESFIFLAVNFFIFLSIGNIKSTFNTNREATVPLFLHLRMSIPNTAQGDINYLNETLLRHSSRCLYHFSVLWYFYY